jgi:hypothetical protein
VPASLRGHPGKHVTLRLAQMKTSEAELRGQEVFYGKGQGSFCCHTPPYFTDNSMHDLHTDSFYK